MTTFSSSACSCRVRRSAVDWSKREREREREMQISGGVSALRRSLSPRTPLLPKNRADVLDGRRFSLLRTLSPPRRAVTRHAASDGCSPVSFSKGCFRAVLQPLLCRAPSLVFPPGRQAGRAGAAAPGGDAVRERGAGGARVRGGLAASGPLGASGSAGVLTAGGLCPCAA